MCNKLNKYTVIFKRNIIGEETTHVLVMAENKSDALAKARIKLPTVGKHHKLYELEDNGDTSTSVCLREKPKI